MSDDSSETGDESVAPDTTSTFVVDDPGRSFLFATGVFFVLFGIVLWLAPAELLGSIPALLDARERVARLGLGALVLAGLLLTRLWHRSTPIGPARPDGTTSLDQRTGRDSAAVQPSLDLDGRLGRVLASEAAYQRFHEDLTADLRDVAIEILCYTEDWSREEAIDQLESGSWTDDPEARALFADRSKTPFRTRFREWLTPRRTYERRDEAVVAQLADLQDS
jgi:uncharacterized protein YjeT (DUF2065 family)